MLKIYLSSFLLLFNGAISLACATQNAQTGKPDIFTKADITGRITVLNRAPSGMGNKNLLGNILVEATERAGQEYDKADVIITTETRLFFVSKGKRSVAGFDDLRVGAQVAATFTGPVAESYPVKAIAAEIVILDKSDSGDDNTHQSDKVSKTQSGELPSGVSSLLNADFPGWKIAEVDARVAEFYKNKAESVPQQILQGDFDGNKLSDYAVNIVHQSGSNRKQSIIVLLNNKRGFTRHVLESSPFYGENNATGVYLTARKKGQKGFDYKANKNFRFRNDAVEVVYFEKSSRIYIFEKNKFRSVLSSD